MAFRRSSIKMILVNLGLRHHTSCRKSVRRELSSNCYSISMLPKSNWNVTLPAPNPPRISKKKKVTWELLIHGISYFLHWGSAGLVFEEELSPNTNKFSACASVASLTWIWWAPEITVPFGHLDKIFQYFMT